MVTTAVLIAFARSACDRNPRRSLSLSTYFRWVAFVPASLKDTDDPTGTSRQRDIPDGKMNDSSNKACDDVVRPANEIRRKKSAAKRRSTSCMLSIDPAVTILVWIASWTLDSRSEVSFVSPLWSSDLVVDRLAELRSFFVNSFDLDGNAMLITVLNAVDTVLA